MSKLVFPSILPASIPYRGFVSEARTWFQRIASWAEKNGPESRAELARQIAPLTAVVGVPSNQIVVTSGVEFAGPAISGTYVNGYTLTIVGGVVTAIVAS